MTDDPWTRISKETVFSCPYYTLSHDRYRLPGGRTGDYHYIDIPGSTMVVAMLPGDDLVVVGQHRYLMGRYSLEFPAGGMKPGVEPRANAAQELREEAGYEAERWEKIGEFAPYNGVSNEMCHVFLARELHSVRPEPEPTEEFRIHHLAPEEIRHKIETGELWDGMTIASFRFFEIWRGGRDDRS
jgi:ADP-ribose pyrophosphatase